ncbi:DUF4291 family protein [Segetibacter sp. 3557_3]|uniref:DUF4291 family protein n=1 Tax=Segetibacter sp. 3557_3 TaxID=2547429 RepID=UPI001058A11F|nr:DUF4291 family protein [Segetibacter sp. 3557_3]
MNTSYDEWKQKLAHSLVIIQCDPDRDLYLQPLEQRAIQIGLSGIAVEKYITEWVIDITDITFKFKTIKQRIKTAWRR